MLGSPIPKTHAWTGIQVPSALSKGHMRMWGLHWMAGISIGSKKEPRSQAKG